MLFHPRAALGISAKIRISDLARVNDGNNYNKPGLHRAVQLDLSKCIL